MRNIETSPCPEIQNKMVASSKGVEVIVYGLDHSGSSSQPFNYTISCRPTLLSYTYTHFLSPLPRPLPPIRTVLDVSTVWVPILSGVLGVRLGYHGTSHLLRRLWNVHSSIHLLHHD